MCHGEKARAGALPIASRPEIFDGSIWQGVSVNKWNTGFILPVLLVAAMAFPAAAQMTDAAASARCIAVSEELARLHDQAVVAYNKRNAAYNANPNPDEAKKLDGMVKFLDRMSEASLEILIFYSKVEVPQAIRDEVKAKKPGELLAMAKTCVDAETARIDQANVPK
jgi:hypothetical protein